MRVEERNEKLIENLIHLIEKDYAKDVDFIGMTGSCMTGKCDNRSDLDLVIILSDDTTRYFGKTFLVDWGDVEIGYDFYSKRWNDMDKMVGTTWVSHIVDVKPIWYRSEEIKTKWNSLVEKAQNELKSSLSEKRIESAKKCLDQAKIKLADMLLNQDPAYAKNCLSNILLEVTDVICLLNVKYFKFGIANRLEDIEPMDKPEDFSILYREALNADEYEDIKRIGTEIVGDVESFFEVKSSSVAMDSEKDSLNGWYEELVSNYKNKVKRIAETNQIELACLASCCIQDYLEEMKMLTGISCPDIYPYFDIHDMDKFSKGFDIVEDAILKEYAKKGIKVSREIY